MLQELTTLFHVIFSVRDFERSLSFYRDTLDFKVYFELRNTEIIPGSGSIINVTRVKRDDDVVGQVELVEFVSTKPKEVPERGYYDLGFWAVVFEVKDIYEIHKIWKARGVEFIREPHKQIVGERTIISALMKDVDGNRIELVQEP